ncbi:general secretion pathway protein H [Desulfurispirillum indicum S5]|uniref:General secretion pathway protein H n=1 Tax=Desulfurispirillum indicum (strain ATCC BAA-1389 / DSM 22839 / S5) TaxID=653733 RepID=E6W5Y7_DESIS|nr:type II secretion system protein [Desulfurispirillum indicum]ADU64926.1 general secretion pathway protein H [Desulfurispirillum indicum S5]
MQKISETPSVAVPVNRKKRQKGFTLIELIMVIVILGILAAIAVPQFVDLSEEAQGAADTANLNAARSAVNMLLASNDGGGAVGTYPTVTELANNLGGTAAVSTITVGETTIYTFGAREAANANCSGATTAVTDSVRCLSLDASGAN